MTANELASNLRYELGITDAGDGGSQIEAIMLQTLNAAIQEIYTIAPMDWVSYKPRAEAVYAPFTANVTVTRDSKGITFAGFAAYMTDCTIIISGDPAQNQLVKDTSSSVSLVKPYNGASGTVSATIYHDCVTLPADVIRLGSPVVLDQAWELRPVHDMRELQLAQPGNYQGIGPYFGTGRDGYGYSAGGGNSSYMLRTQDKRVERPYAFLTGRIDSYHLAQQLCCILSALPEQRYTLEYSGQVPPFITSLSDTTRPQYLPFKNDEAILMPWAAWKFADNKNVTTPKSQLKAGYDSALSMLNRMNPQPFRPSSVAVGGF